MIGEAVDPGVSFQHEGENQAEQVLEERDQDGVHQGDTQVSQQTAVAEQLGEVVESGEVDLRLERTPVGERVDEVEERRDEEEDDEDCESRSEEPEGVILAATSRPGSRPRMP